MTKDKGSHSKIYNAGQAIGTIIGLILFCLIAALLLVLLLWIISLPNWTLFFTWLKADTLLQYVKTLAWPFVILIVLIVLRSELTSLFERMIGFRFGGASASFAPNPIPPQPSNPPKNGAEEIENINTSERSSSTHLEDLLQDSEVITAFDTVYNFIFGTQIQAMSYITANGGQASGLDLKRFFDAHTKLLADTKATNNFKDTKEFMNYIVTYNLMSFEEKTDTYTILPAGRIFLLYLASKGRVPNDRAL